LSFPVVSVVTILPNAEDCGVRPIRATIWPIHFAGFKRSRGWERAPDLPPARNREIAVRGAVQDWCNWFEEKLRANPENWVFWLDKRWSRFLGATPRARWATNNPPVPETASAIPA
jgi:hypothetical protein